ncbi:MAG: DsbA family protein [Dehalococcoidia bacterium]|jgi:predicted DsbA family dithiol-disulfide isomerase|nr:DsbA family protein [Dehalococcoidia bacterium]MDP6781985.1 DsbA family protein [Dehalococcoidia bacterium]
MAVKIALFSDYICPFCFVAASRLERISREVSLEVVWRGVQIHPETPPEGEPMSDGLRHKLSFPEGSIQHFVVDEGLEFRVPSVVPNSRLALEATEYAAEQGKFPRFHRAVFEAYWQQDRDIGRVTVLSEIAREVGLDAADLEGYLKKGGGKARLQANVEEAATWQVVGMPTFVFAGRFLLEGVQAYEVLKRGAIKAAEP